MQQLRPHRSVLAPWSEAVACANLCSPRDTSSSPCSRTRRAASQWHAKFYRIAGISCHPDANRCQHIVCLHCYGSRQPADASAARGAVGVSVADHGGDHCASGYENAGAKSHQPAGATIALWSHRCRCASAVAGQQHHRRDNRAACCGHPATVVRNVRSQVSGRIPIRLRRSVTGSDRRGRSGGDHSGETDQPGLDAGDDRCRARRSHCP